jgi:hypothetical protein
VAAFKLASVGHRGGKGVGIRQEIDRRRAGAGTWEREYKILAAIGTRRNHIFGILGANMTGRAATRAKVGGLFRGWERLGKRGIGEV